MITSAELFSRLRDYLKGRSTLREFEGWLIPKLGTFDLDSYLSYVAGTVHLYMIEIHEGVRTERSAKMFLRKHFAFHLTTTPDYSAQQVSDTNTTTVKQPDNWLASRPSVPQPA